MYEGFQTGSGVKAGEGGVQRFPWLHSPGRRASLIIYRGQVATSGSGIRRTSRSYPVSVSAFCCRLSPVIFPSHFLPSPPSFLAFLCPLSLHLPGRDNRVPVESRDAAEGIFEREIWLQTFHLVAVPGQGRLQGSWAVGRHTPEEGGGRRGETREKRKGDEMQ